MNFNNFKDNNSVTTQTIDSSYPFPGQISSHRTTKHLELKTAKKRAERLYYLIITYISSFAGIASVAYLNQKFFSSTDMVLLIGSFGATAVIIYGLPDSPLAKPKTVLVGHILSSFIGVTAYWIFKETPWIAAGVAVATAIFAMQITNSIHPPGGATALIAVIGSSKIHALGYLFVLMPVGLGAGILVSIGLLVKTISSKKKKRFKKFLRKLF